MTISRRSELHSRRYSIIASWLLMYCEAHFLTKLGGTARIFMQHYVDIGVHIVAEIYCVFVYDRTHPVLLTGRVPLNALSQAKPLPSPCPHVPIAHRAECLPRSLETLFRERKRLLVLHEVITPCDLVNVPQHAASVLALLLAEVKQMGAIFRHLTHTVQVEITADRFHTPVNLVDVLD